ncbi:MAG: hypothetical protein LBU69_03035 [Deltaproteobacteria bacterium]|jgi:hypothetical protein|nr:hypothetical protein [Deltaproteobacteria bacterium]
MTHEPNENFIIAVTQKTDEGLATTLETELLTIFHKSAQGWVIDRTVEFSFSGVNGLCQARKRLHEMARELEGVSAMISRGYPGISMEVLSKAGFVLYELNGFSQEALSAVEENARDLAREKETVPNVPYETEEGSGDYFLNLRQALNAFPEQTTKKILRPFFDSTKFATLRVIYDHLPPWLPQEIKSRNYAWEKEAVPGGILITIVAPTAQPCKA